MNKIHFGKIGVIIFLLLVFQKLNAANLYWYGHTNTTFSTASNWSTSSSSYAAAGAAPGSSDIANFGNYTGITNANCSPNASVNVQGINFVSGYTGTFTQGANSITIGSGGGTFSAGTFSGGSASITATGAITISGTSFTSTSGTFSCSGNFTISSGSFTHNSGILQLTATSTLTVSNTGGTTFYKLDFSPSSAATFTITSTTTINVANLLTYSGSGAITLNSGTINLQGGLTVTNTGTTGGGSATIKLNSTPQTLTGPTTLGQGILPNVTFTNSSASTYTISGTTLTVGGTLAIAGTGALTFNTGTINLSGNIVITNTGTSGGGSATLNMNGTGAQTFTGSGTANSGLTPNITIDKSFSSGTLTLSSIIACGGNWTYTKGKVDAITNASVVSMNGNKNLDGQGTDSTMIFYRIGVQSGTTTLTGNLIAANNIVLASGTTLLGNGFNINVGGKWNNQGATWTPGSGTVTFYGSGYGFIQKSGGTETFGNLALNKTANGTKLICPVSVTGVLTLTGGRLTTSSTNYLNLSSTATTSGGSNTAYVNGPMQKTGNSSFVFPLGDSILSTPYHPLGITAPASSSEAYMAQYKGTGQTSGSSLASTLASVSNCEYWTLQRTAPSSGTTTITPTLNWNTVCANVNYSEMSVAAWNGTQWIDDGAGTLNASSPQGSLAASTALSFTNATTVVPVLLAKKLVVHSYATLQQEPGGGYYNTDGNVLYFRYEEEYKDANGYISYQVINPATNTTVSLLSNSSTTNVPVIYGTNNYKMDLYTAANTPLASGKYILVVTNDKNETFQLMFNKN
jgi:hypothetical protein